MARLKIFLGEPVRYFDYTWFRSVPPGPGTASHCDIVYMGRGERERLFTVWTPIGDIAMEHRLRIHELTLSDSNVRIVRFPNDTLNVSDLLTTSESKEKGAA